MRKFLFCLFLVPFFSQSQQFYSTEDYLTRFNPSAFGKTDIYTTALFNLSDVQHSESHYSYLNHKLRIKKLSVGINADYQQISSLKTMRGGVQVAYPILFSKGVRVYSGVGINLNRDNIAYYSSPSEQKWNPYYLGGDFGFSLLVKRFHFGVSATNILIGDRYTDGAKTNLSISYSSYCSYDFKLDSLGKYHLVPSLVLDYIEKGGVSTMSNLRFDFNNHAIGSGFNSEYISLFYHYNFRNNFKLGVSIGRYRSILGNGLDGWNPMVRLNYQLKKIKPNGTPSF